MPVVSYHYPMNVYSWINVQHSKDIYVQNKIKRERPPCSVTCTVGTFFTERYFMMLKIYSSIWKLIKKKTKFSSYIRKSKRKQLQSHMLQSHIWLNICAFPPILGSPSSYMTLQPLPSEFPYTVYDKNIILFFISETRGGLHRKKW
jgi:hypothetical protein